MPLLLLWTSGNYSELIFRRHWSLDNLIITSLSVFLFFLAPLYTKVLKRALLCRDLKSITDREVCCFMISCKNSTNIDTVIDWLVKHSKSKGWECPHVAWNRCNFFVSSFLDVASGICMFDLVAYWFILVLFLVFTDAS